MNSIPFQGARLGCILLILSALAGCSSCPSGTIYVAVQAGHKCVAAESVVTWVRTQEAAAPFLVVRLGPASYLATSGAAPGCLPKDRLAAYATLAITSQRTRRD